MSDLDHSFNDQELYKGAQRRSRQFQSQGQNYEIKMINQKVDEDDLDLYISQAKISKTQVGNSVQDFNNNTHIKTSYQDACDISIKPLKSGQTINKNMKTPDDSRNDITSLMDDYQLKNSNSLMNTKVDSSFKVSKLDNKNRQQLNQTTFIENDSNELETVSPVKIDKRLLHDNSNLKPQINNQRTSFRNQLQGYVPITYRSNFLKRIYFVSKFIKKMKIIVIILSLILKITFIYLTNFRIIQQQIQNRSLSNLNLFFFELINDLSSNNQRINKKDKSKKSQFNLMLSHIQTFQQDSSLILYWDLIQYITIFIQFIWIPLKSAFNLDGGAFTIGFFNTIPCAIFIFAIIMKFNTEIYNNQGNVVKDRKKIAQSYLKSSFFIDILTTTVLILSNSFENSVIIFIFTLRWSQFSSLELKLKSNLQMKQGLFNTLIKNIQLVFILQYQRYNSFSSEYELFKLAGIILLVAHFCACGFYFVGHQYYTDKNWIKTQGLTLEHDWKVLYVNSLYFSILTMITVGYGDIVPINVYEKIYVMIITLISCGIFAFSVNKIGEIFRESQLKNEYYYQQQYDILNYLQKREVSKHISLKVVKQLKYINKQELSQRGEQVLDKMSEQLKQEVKQEFYGSILQQNKIFSKLFSKQFLIKLSLKMKDMNLYPNETLQKIGDLSNKLYFIHAGTLSTVFESDKDHEIQQYEKGSIIGFQEFVNFKVYDVTYKSINVTNLVYFEYQDFMDLIIQFQEDYVNSQFNLFLIIKEKFCMVRDLSFQGSQYSLYSEEQCCCCKLFNHSTHKCPCIAFSTSKDIIIKRFNLNFAQKRALFTRRTQKISFTQSSLRKKRIDYLMSEQREDIDYINIYDEINEISEWDDQNFLMRLPALRLYFQEGQIIIDYNYIEDFYEEDREDTVVLNNSYHNINNQPPIIHKNKQHNSQRQVSLKTIQSMHNNEDSQLMSSEEEEKKSRNRLDSKDSRQGDPASMVENLQSINAKGILLFTENNQKSYYKSNIVIHDQRRVQKMMNSKMRISEQLIEESQNWNVLSQSNCNIQDNHQFNYNRGNSIKINNIEAQQMQMSKRNIVHPYISQNSLSNSQQLILQGGQISKKLEYQNSSIGSRNSPHYEKKGTKMSMFDEKSSVKRNQSQFIQGSQTVPIMKQKHFVNMNPFENLFDRLKEYKIYFPQFNIGNILFNKKTIKKKKTIANRLLPSVSRRDSEFNVLHFNQFQSNLAKKRYSINMPLV